MTLLTQFIKPENVPSLLISLLALAIAFFSARYTYKNYKINEGPEWRLKKVNDSVWQLERNHRRRVVLIGVATIPSWLGYKISIVGPYPKFYGKGDTLTFKISSSTTLGSLEDIMLCVFFKPFFFKRFNRNSYNENLTREILEYDEPRDDFLEAIKTMQTRDNPPPTLLEKLIQLRKKWMFKIRTLRISSWNSSLL